MISLSKVKLITNFCPHYRVKLFEELNKKEDISFHFFSGGNDKFWNKEIPVEYGDFTSTNLGHLPFLSKKDFNIGIYNLINDKKTKIIIKCIGGKFNLPFSYILSRLFKKKFILWTGMWEHPQKLIHQISFPFTKYIYKNADAIVVYGEHVKSYLVSLGVPSDKVFIGWQTVDNEKFNKKVTLSDKKEIEKNYKYNFNKKVVLCVSRLVEEKGISYLIKAMNNMENVELLIIGNGPLKDSLIDLAEQNNVDLKLINYVKNTDVYKFIGLSNIFVLPSISTKTFKEPWGLVINEVMNQGTPIITTNAVGAAVGGLLENEKNALIVEEKNEHQLKVGLQRLLQDSSLSKTLEINSKKDIEKWTYPRMANGFIEAIKSVEQ